MRLRITGPLVVALLVMVTTAAAGADYGFACCTQNANQPATRDCLAAVEDAANAALDTIVGHAMDTAAEVDKATMSDRAVPALQAAQDGWSQYREWHCAYDQATDADRSGVGIAALRCRIDLTWTRVAELMGYVQWLDPADIRRRTVCGSFRLR